MPDIDLLGQLKQLKKSAKPKVSPPRDRKRKQRIMQFEEENGISLK
jgi:hypothetical protein